MNEVKEGGSSDRLQATVTVTLSPDCSVGITR